MKSADDMTLAEILFLSHNIHHQRCHYLTKDLTKYYNVLVPRPAVHRGKRLSLSMDSASNMFYLGIACLQKRTHVHLDGIDIFIHPFVKGLTYLHDYHVPIVEELKWLGLGSLAAVAHALLPDSLRSAKVVITPNKEMLRLALTYACFDEYYIIPNYPPKSFLIDIDQETARHHLGLPTDKRIALFVGGARLREIYGIDLLIKSWLNVHKKRPDALLYVIGPSEQLGFTRTQYTQLERRGIFFPGRVDHGDVPKWIAAADLCLSQRSPGFPVKWYNIYDSLKLSEYALFEKPIVAAGYLPGEDYISADTTVESYSRAILAGLDGEAPRPTPHTWEENQSVIRKAYDSLVNG